MKSLRYHLLYHISEVNNDGGQFLEYAAILQFLHKLLRKASATSVEGRRQEQDSGTRRGIFFFKKKKR